MLTTRCNRAQDHRRGRHGFVGMKRGTERIRAVAYLLGNDCFRTRAYRLDGTPRSAVGSGVQQAPVAGYE